MQLAVHEYEEAYYIGADPQYKDPQPVAVSSNGPSPAAISQAPPHMEYRGGLWTGSGWSGHYDDAMKFDSREAAEAYVEENRGRMEGAKAHA